jgi:hypothetical protein
MTDQKRPPRKVGKKPGRKPAEGIDKRKFLATMESETIKSLKLAAIQKNSSASEILEEAAVQWLERWKSTAKKT